MTTRPDPGTVVTAEPRLGEERLPARPAIVLPDSPNTPAEPGWLRLWYPDLGGCEPGTLNVQVIPAAEAINPRPLTDLPRDWVRMAWQNSSFGPTPWLIMGLLDEEWKRLQHEGTSS